MSEPEFKREFVVKDLRDIIKNGSPEMLRKYAMQHMPEGELLGVEAPQLQSNSIRKLSAIQFNNGDLLEMKESEKVQLEL